MLQACLNGSRTKLFNPAVPMTLRELANDARAVVLAGATELHVHPRDANGIESLEASDVAAALAAMRDAVPGVPIGLSTHWNIPPGGRLRQSAIAVWVAVPDYVSVNLIEDDAPEIMSLVLSNGIAVEAGLWSVEDAQRFAQLDVARNCLRVLIEINEQNADEAREVAAAIVAELDQAKFTLPRLLHGFDQTKWQMHRMAVAAGFDSRIGFEDGECLPDGTRATSNADLIKAALGQ